MVHDATYFVQKLKLQKHPEGGYFKETYRSAEMIPAEYLPKRFSGARNISTAIYFLLEGNQFSAFHRIKSDELWHFYYGRALNIFIIDEAGTLEIIKLGGDLNRGETFQAVVKAGCWFASKPVDENSFSLVGCTVAPCFDFADFELAKADELANQFPKYENLIRKYCRH